MDSAADHSRGRKWRQRQFSRVEANSKPLVGRPWKPPCGDIRIVGASCPLSVETASRFRDKTMRRVRRASVPVLQTVIGIRVNWNRILDERIFLLSQHFALRRHLGIELQEL
jgi:hypothetical protein